MRFLCLPLVFVLAARANYRCGDKARERGGTTPQLVVEASPIGFFALSGLKCHCLAILWC